VRQLSSGCPKSRPTTKPCAPSRTGSSASSTAAYEPTQPAARGVTWPASTRWPSLRPGPTCGSAGYRTVISRRSASTTPAGQHLYHPDWRARQDELKFVRVTRAAGRLPAMRAAALEDLADEEMTRDKACAAAVRLLDLGCFLIGAIPMPTATRSAHHARTPPRTSLR
jgi:hypothetical protein